MLGPAPGQGRPTFWSESRDPGFGWSESPRPWPRCLAIRWAIRVVYSSFQGTDAEKTTDPSTQKRTPPSCEAAGRPSGGRCCGEPWLFVAPASRRIPSLQAAGSEENRLVALHGNLDALPRADLRTQQKRSQPLRLSLETSLRCASSCSASQTMASACAARRGAARRLKGFHVPPLAFKARHPPSSSIWLSRHLKSRELFPNSN